MKRALLAIYTDGHFTELVRVARLLVQSGRWQPVVYFARPYAQKDRDLRTCQAEGWSYVDLAPSPQATPADDAASAPADSVPVARRIKGALRAALVSLPFPFTVVRAIARQAQQIVRKRRVIREQQPHIAVLCEDSVGYETAALIKAAHEAGIASVLVPFTVANALEPAEAYYRDPAFDADRGANRIAAWLYPAWVFTHRGRRLVRLPAAQLLAKQWLRLAPPRPWTINTGSADVLAVESPFMEAYYRREGMPPPPLEITGTLADDVLAEGQQEAPAARVRLCAELGLPAGRPLLVCALPPDQFLISGVQSEFADYGEMVEFWVATLASLDGWNVVVRTHPRMDAGAFRTLERANVRLSRWDTAALVPLCDLYVACVSATIRWAVACGKPAVNYDVFRLRFTDYVEAAGVIEVDSQASFAEVLRRLTTDWAFYEETRARQEACASQWGRVDGKVGTRLLGLFDRLSAPVAAPRGSTKEAS